MLSKTTLIADQEPENGDNDFSFEDGALPGLATARKALQDQYDQAIAAASIAKDPSMTSNFQALARSRTVKCLHSKPG